MNARRLARVRIALSKLTVEERGVIAREIVSPAACRCGVSLADIVRRNPSAAVGAAIGGIVGMLVDLPVPKEISVIFSPKRIGP